MKQEEKLGHSNIIPLQCPRPMLQLRPTRTLGVFSRLVSLRSVMAVVA